MAREWPLVGRQDEFAYALDALGDEDGAGLVLAGAAGVGKSRLAQELFATLRAQGRRVIQCSATSAAASIPFGAVAELVPDLDVAVDNRLAVFRAVAAALTAAPGEPAPVVGLDDAHLVDEATAALIHHIATRKLASLVITIRLGEPVNDAITTLWKDGHCRRLDVQTLGRTEVNELVTAVLGGPADRTTRERLWSLSLGNALLLREIVLQALDDGSLQQHLGFWQWSGAIQMGERLIDIVRLGLGRLSVEERDVLGLLAYGEPLGAAAVGAMSDAAALGKLVDRGIVRTRADGQRQHVILDHPLYGEVIRAETGAAEAAALMRRLAGDLVERGARRSGDAGRLGAWALGSDMPVPAEILERAASEAYRASDFELAEQLARADADWPVHPTAFVLGSALAALGRDDEAHEVFTAAGVAPPSDEWRARVAYQHIDLLFHRRQRHDDAAAVFTRAMAGMTDPMWRDLLAVGWAPSLILMGRSDEAAALVEPMAASPEPRTRLAALRGLGFLLVPRGQTARILALCDNLLGPALELQAEWEYGLVDVMSARILALMMEGRLEEAAAILDLGDSAIDAARNPAGYVFLNVGRGRLDLFRGAPVAAAERIREAVASFTPVDLTRRGPWALRLLAESLALVGDIGGATEALHAARRADGPLLDPFLSDGHRAEAWLAAATGDVEGAARQLLEAAATVQAAGHFGYEAMILHDAVRLGAAGLAPRLDALRSVVDGPIVTAYAAHARAKADGDGAALEAASAGFEELGFLLLAAEAATEASTAHHASGLVARSAAAAARANTLRARCEGATTPALIGGPDVEPLSRREREVATMASRGLTSKAIGETLHLSSRTVDNHLQRAYEKLGVRRREDLAKVLGLEIE
jgi:DNA-binding CsgD family transcriptional regulator/tetratricopeptide (TPR) repeat protein